MCKFCEGIKDYKTIKIPVRTSMADNNICEKVSSKILDDGDNRYILEEIDCTNCNGCSDENNYFEVALFSNDSIDINYYHKIRDTVIAPVSTRFCINYCPMCGKRLSEIVHSDELNFW